MRILAPLSKVGISGRGLVVVLPYLWLMLFFVVPFVIVLKISFSDIDLAIPPYKPLLEWVGKNSLAIKLNFNNYAFLFTDRLYINAFLNSIKVAFISTLLCLLVGYPMAYGIARAKPATRNVLLLLVVLPFWPSLLLRVYAWIGLLKANGVINNVLMWLGVIREPLTLLYTPFAMYVGIVYSYLPFFILPMYANLEKMDWQLLEAAEDLGCRPWQAFYKITLPLSRNGILAGSMLVFIPAVGEFVIPALLGGPNALMIGRVLWDEFFSNRAWPVASAVAILLLVLLVPFMMWYQSVQARESAGARLTEARIAGGCVMNYKSSYFILTCLGFGFAFLYIPILSMVVFSFNASKLVTVWDAANSPTLKWYYSLLNNEEILDAAWISLKVAVINASGAVILGTLAGFGLGRFSQFKGRFTLNAMTTAPLVMPEVITGLSLLLLFVALEQLIGWPAGRGITTMTISHMTFSMAYVTVIVNSRLATFDTALEEAAMDLGARPLKVFFVITLPIIFPAILSGWLLAFTLSWDDLVISSFTSGPGSSTLPMVVFSKVRLGVSPEINVLATITLAVVSTMIVGVSLWMARRDRLNAG